MQDDVEGDELHYDRIIMNADDHDVVLSLLRELNFSVKEKDALHWKLTDKEGKDVRFFETCDGQRREERLSTAWEFLVDLTAFIETNPESRVDTSYRCYRGLISS